MQEKEWESWCSTGPMKRNCCNGYYSFDKKDSPGSTMHFGPHCFKDPLYCIWLLRELTLNQAALAEGKSSSEHVLLLFLATNQNERALFNVEIGAPEVPKGSSYLCRAFAVQALESQCCPVVAYQTSSLCPEPWKCGQDILKWNAALAFTDNSDNWLQFVTGLSEKTKNGRNQVCCLQGFWGSGAPWNIYKKSTFKKGAHTHIYIYIYIRQTLL